MTFKKVLQTFTKIKSAKESDKWCLNDLLFKMVFFTIVYQQKDQIDGAENDHAM
jgi:hypothetical protein